MDFSRMILLSLILCGEINIAEASSITSNNHLYSRQTICTDGSKGYTKLGDINYDQQEEYERIRRGENLIRSQYKFILCEGTIFDASDEPLEVYLDGSLFSCGENNDSFFESTSECVISGGTEQVIIGLGKKFKAKCQYWISWHYIWKIYKFIDRSKRDKEFKGNFPSLSMEGFRHIFYIQYWITESRYIWCNSN